MTQDAARRLAVLSDALSLLGGIPTSAEETTTTAALAQLSLLLSTSTNEPRDDNVVVSDCDENESIDSLRRQRDSLSASLRELSLKKRAADALILKLKLLLAEVVQPDPWLETPK
ncbi:hypothetical protein BC830DRAFT_1163290 [Chytriomyces sp. MP71]|nr:hypothetical protein BC830DRAFT_1163290 [Chytriomyces sp. MP71]